MVLAAPAFKVKLYVPFARTGLRLLSNVFKGMRINSYVKARALSHDPERVASYEADSLIQRPISVRVLLGLYDTADRIIQDAQAIRVPTQLLISGNDFVVHKQPQHDFFERLGSSVKEKHVFDGFFHDTLGEKERFPAISKAREFLVRSFEQEPVYAPLLDADQHGFTKTEFDSLREPLPALSAKALNFGILRISMGTGGRLSRGIRLGFETGFDSGSTLDYIYQNEPGGLTAVGRLIDKSYLNAIGWRGIRVRKQHMIQMLVEAVKRLRQAGLPVRILDIAAGHGRYVVEAIQRMETKPDSVLLRDYSERNVSSGSTLLGETQMSSFARFERGDAFDRASLSAIEPRPTLAIVSGLYELFPDNSMVHESLAGVADATEPDGFLVYTGQPWHPQLEMIARVLPSHRGHQPWVMRRRTQAEMDDLVAAAGFRKVGQLIDEWGIFSVSLAERVSSGPSGR